MTQRLDALMVRESNGKSYFNKIGAAFPTKTGGYSVILDAMPASVDGQFKILLMVPKERDDQPQRTPQASPRQNVRNDLDSDHIPF